jgi:hypothetical protein
MAHSDADVASAVQTIWSMELERRKAEAALAEYGVAPHEREAPRVKLAILKLSQGQLDRLADLVSHAKRDYRDVLMWAEYPEEGRSIWVLSSRMTSEQNNQLAAIRQRDRDQYERWLADLRGRRTRG